MTETTLRCPSCGQDIPLTETLAAPIIAKARAEMAADVKKRLDDVEAKERQLEEAKKGIDRQVSEKLEAERKVLSEKLAAEARSGVESELDELRVAAEAATKRAADGRKDRLALLQQLEEAKAAAEKAGEDAKRQLQAERDKLVKETKEAAAEQAKLDLAGRDQTIEGLKNKINELKQRAEQGSQQAQGEAQEIVLEQALADEFPTDLIDEVPKGVSGADCLQRVVGQAGVPAGTIIWESKRTRRWTAAWTGKLKEHMRNAGADVAVIVSAVLPEDVRHFGLEDGVWVSDFASALPLAHALRHTLLEVAHARRSAEGRETKAEEVYEYVTGTAFRQSVERILEVYQEMAKDLASERAAFERMWAKRDAQIRRLARGTVGIVGQLQGIAGRKAVEIETIEVKALAAPENDGNASAESE